MKRSGGVTAAAVILLVYGLVSLIAAGELPGIMFHLHPGQNVLRAVALPVFRELVVGVGMIATSYGILKLRRWALLSILSLSVGMIGFGVYLWLAAYLALPNHGVWNRGRPMDSPLSAALEFLLALAAPGVWWLVLFTRPGVKRQFQPQIPDAPETNRTPAVIAER